MSDARDRNGVPEARLDLRRVICFVAVADALSFRRAGERLTADPRWVSAQVRGLEDALGVALLERHGGGISLTEAGVRLRAESSDLLRVNRAAVAAMAAARRASENRLLIVASPVTGWSLVRVELIAALLAEAPQTRVEVDDQPSAEAPARVLRGLADAGLVLSPFDRPGLRCVLLTVARHSVVMLRSHPLADRADVGIEDLEGVGVGAFGPAHNPPLYEQLFGPLHDVGALVVTIPELHPAAYADAVRTDGLIVIDVNDTVRDRAAQSGHPPLVSRPLSGLEGVADTYLIARRRADHPRVNELIRVATAMSPGRLSL